MLPGEERKIPEVNTMNKLFWPVVACAACSLSAGAASLQETINAAEPGSVVAVPAGTYREALQLKDGVFLAGEGAETTILDGEGADVVVRAGKDSAIIGFTIRNGNTAVHNGGNFFGVFECVLTNFARAGIALERGAGVIANNVIEGDGNGRGILCAGANPYIDNNHIRRNQCGLLVWDHHIPVAVNNLFSGNTIAIQFARNATAVLRRNVYDGNGQVVMGGAPGETDEIRPIRPGDARLARGARLDAYRALMKRARAEAVALHPVVSYDLSRGPGLFDVVVRFPWATFTIGASAKDTRIIEYGAYDWQTDAGLSARYVVVDGDRPAVEVRNDELTEKAQDRYVLEKLYAHAASFRDAGDGSLVFERDTNLSRIEVRLPPGYAAVEVSHDAEVAQEGAQQVLRITDVGLTHVKVVMRKPGS
jgi:hypothetical protein